MSEAPKERYAYIKFGSEYENPSSISAHDRLIGKCNVLWHQDGTARAYQASGRWKIEFVEDEEYIITLRRFSRESGLALITAFPEEEHRIELDRPTPVSIKNNFTESYLNVTHISETIKIKKEQN